MDKEKLELYNRILADYNTGNFKLKELSLKYGIKYDTISKNIRSMGAITFPHGKISLNSNIFNTIDTEEKAYWLGFLYADGSLYKDAKNSYRFELGLQERDLNHIEKFKEFISSKHPIKYRQSTKSYRISFNDTVFAEDLIRLGCVPKKSLILKFPNKTQIPKEYLRHFIRGYFDGDGYLSKPPKQLTVSLLGTMKFLEGVFVYNYHELGINGNWIKKDKRHVNNTYYFDLFGDRARKFLDHIYDNSNIFLTRKKELYENMKQKQNEKQR